MLFQMFVDKIFCDFLLSSEQSFKPVPSFSAVYVPVGSEKSAVGPPPSGYIWLVLYSTFIFLSLCTLVADTWRQVFVEHFGT